MIEITYYGIDRVLDILNGSQDKPGLLHDGDQNTKKVVLPLFRIVRKFGEEMEDFLKAKKALINQYTEGREITEEVDKELNENDLFLKEWKDLHNEVVTVDAPKIDPEDLRGVPVSTLLALSPILQDVDG